MSKEVTEKSKETKEKNHVSIISDPDKLTIEYIDFVHLRSNESIVQLDLLQNLPGDGKQARIAGRYAFSWHQIKQIRDLLDRKLDEHEKKIKSIIKGEE